MTRSIIRAVIAVALATGMSSFGYAAEPVKAVYHVNDGTEQARRALGNIRNHLTADPDARIVVVTHGSGIDFLLTGAKDTNGSAFSNDIDELSLRGVEFRVCRFTLERRRIDASRVVAEGKIVPSGVAEVARLQAREGYAYLRP